MPIACSFSSPLPSTPAAAAAKASYRRRFARSTTAIARSLFVGNSRNRYACEMPARLATSAVGVPWIPRAAITGIAAFRTASRRSSAVDSVRVALGSIGVSMHSLTPSVNPLWHRRGQTPRGQTPSARDLADDPAGVPDGHDAGRDVLRDHAPRSDHRRPPDRDARADDCAAAEPDVVLDGDRAAELAPGG